MQALSKFLPYVIPYVQGCSDPMAEQAILSACIEFATSAAVVQTTTPVSVVAAQQDYDVDIPSQMALVAVQRVFYKNSLLSPVPLNSVLSGLAMQGVDIGDATVRVGAPQAYFLKDPTGDIISLYPIPDTQAAVANGLTIQASFSPTRSATQVDDVLFNSYAEDIAYGAIGRLLGIPGQLFTNTPLATQNLKQFAQGVSSAKAVGRTGQLVSSSRVRAVRFA